MSCFVLLCFFLSLWFCFVVAGLSRVLVVGSVLVVVVVVFLFLSLLFFGRLFRVIFGRGRNSRRGTLREREIMVLVPGREGIGRRVFRRCWGWGDTSLWNHTHVAGGND